MQRIAEGRISQGPPKRKALLDAGLCSLDTFRSNQKSGTNRIALKMEKALLWHRLSKSKIGPQGAARDGDLTSLMALLTKAEARKHTKTSNGGSLRQLPMWKVWKDEGFPWDFLMFSARVGISKPKTTMARTHSFGQQAALLNVLQLYILQKKRRNEVFQKCCDFVCGKRVWGGGHLDLCRWLVEAKIGLHSQQKESPAVWQFATNILFFSYIFIIPVEIFASILDSDIVMFRTNATLYTGPCWPGLAAVVWKRLPS